LAFTEGCKRNKVNVERSTSTHTSFALPVTCHTEAPRHAASTVEGGKNAMIECDNQVCTIVHGNKTATDANGRNAALSFHRAQCKAQSVACRNVRDRPPVNGSSNTQNFRDPNLSHAASAPHERYLGYWAGKDTLLNALEPRLTIRLKSHRM